MMKFIAIYIIVGLVYGTLNLINERENLVPLLKDLKNGYLIVAAVLLYFVFAILIGAIMMTFCIITIPEVIIINFQNKKLNEKLEKLKKL